MTISPSSHNAESNMKPREVRCERCKEHWITDDMNPQCQHCHLTAITVVRSVANIHELGSSSS